MSAPFQINFGPSSSNVDGGEGFAARCKDLFDVLSSHAPKKTREETQTVEEEVRPAGGRPNFEITSDYKGRESIFREKHQEKFAIPRSVPRRGGGHRGFPGPRASHRVPGHVLNPTKYTKYSLEDTDMTSDKGNARAAFDFLREQRERKQKEEADQVEGGNAGGSERITFKKPPRRAAEATSPVSPQQPASSAVAFGGAAKRVLPECVVGGGRVAPGASKRPRPVRSSQEADDDDEKEDQDDRVDVGEDIAEGEPGKTSKKKSKAAPKLSFSFDDE